MKKLLLLTLLLSVTIVSHAQSVLGIPFGSSYEKVKSALEERFGKYNVYEKEGVLKLYGLKVGDFHFDYGTFEFQRDGSLTFFSGAEFQSHYDLTNATVAKSDRDYLFDLLKDKYADEYLGEYINEQGFKCYKFGLNPKDTSKVLGLIRLEKGKSKGGDMYLYLNLDYGPIYYVNKATDF